MREDRGRITLPGVPVRLPHQRALVVGLGRSGVAAAQLLLEAGVEVRGYDRRHDVSAPAGVRTFFGEPTDAVPAFEGVDLVVLSPGVDPGPWRAMAARLSPHARIEGELGLALRLPEAAQPTVLVTGTNGKSTVTAMTGALVAASGREVFVGGNLGEPPSEALLAVARGDFHRLEHALKQAPHATRAHPTTEHFLPLLVAAGAASVATPFTVLDGGIRHGVLAMES